MFRTKLKLKLFDRVSVDHPHKVNQNNRVVGAPLRIN